MAPGYREVRRGSASRASRQGAGREGIGFRANNGIFPGVLYCTAPAADGLALLSVMPTPCGDGRLGAETVGLCVSS